MVLSKKIKIGSKVKVITGKFKGKDFSITKVFRSGKSVKVLLSGANYKFNLSMAEDGRTKVQSEKAVPIDISNVCLIK